MHIFHAWDDTSRCFMEFLYQLRKLVCNAVGPAYAASLEHLADL